MSNSSVEICVVYMKWAVKITSPLVSTWYASESLGKHQPSRIRRKWYDTRSVGRRSGHKLKPYALDVPGSTTLQHSAPSPEYAIHMNLKQRLDTGGANGLSQGVFPLRERQMRHFKPGRAHSASETFVARLYPDGEGSNMHACMQGEDRAISRSRFPRKPQNPVAPRNK